VPFTAQIENTYSNDLTASKVSSGKILDFAVEECIDADGNQRCSKPFLVTKSTCYEIKWDTDGAISHTTVEVRDAGSDELVFYRDTNGEWTPEKGEVSLSPLRQWNEADYLCSLSILTSSRRCGRLVTIP